jgi:intracellular multiplication protein IcmP
MPYPAQQNATDQTASFFWYITLIAAALILAWLFGRAYIVPFIFFIRGVEAELIKWTLEAWNGVASALGLSAIDLTPFDKMHQFMADTAAEKVKIKQVDIISLYIGEWLRYPVILILLGLAAFSFFRHRTLRFKQAYTMSSFRSLEVENWPHITPIMAANILDSELDKGPWAMAMAPKLFCQQNNLLHTTKVRDTDVYGVNQGAAEQIFVMQMGAMIQDLNKLPIHVKALIVIFISKVRRKKSLSNSLLDQISSSASHGKLDFTSVTDHFQKYKKDKIISWVLQRHAYVGTFMATLIEVARSEGVLATAEFIWLKPLDRRLWYILNSVGRQTAVVEVAGMFAHWLAEKKLKRALRTPMVKEAVVALEGEMKNILYVDEEQRWQDNSAV